MGDWCLERGLERERERAERGAIIGDGGLEWERELLLPDGTDEHDGDRIDW